METREGMVDEVRLIDPVERLSELESRFRPRLAWALAHFVAYALLIVVGMLCGVTVGMQMSGALMGFCTAVVIFWESAMFFGSKHYIVVHAGRLSRVEECSTMSTRYDTADFVIVVTTSGVFQGARIDLLLKDPDPYWMWVDLRDDGTFVAAGRDAARVRAESLHELVRGMIARTNSVTCGGCDA